MAALAGFTLVALLGWVFFPILGRIVGAGMVVVGLAAATGQTSWAGPTIAIGAGLWLAGSWLHTAKTSYYSSALARVLFEHTPLKWTLWQYHRARAMQR